MTLSLNDAVENGCVGGGGVSGAVGGWLFLVEKKSIAIFFFCPSQRLLVYLFLSDTEFRNTPSPTRDKGGGAEG